MRYSCRQPEILMSAAMSVIDAIDNVRALQWNNGSLGILDQRKLPDVFIYEEANNVEAVAEAIHSMRVRGAPAIGIAAAYGVVLAAAARYREDSVRWKSLIQQDIALLAQSRPTAVNLFWALERMKALIDTLEGEPVAALEQLAIQLHEEDVAANRRMGASGAALLAGADGVLTHCNTGSLATGGYGTALGVVRSAWKAGLRKIYATETRPWMQGARLTIWELDQDRIPATLIADSAAAWLMRSGAVQWVIVGADRIAANGDTANKIGTYALAVLARQHGVKFMVVAPCSTIDWKTPEGGAITIEQRDGRELLSDYFQQEGRVINAWNPVFDVTPAHLIDAIVTERGVVTNPDSEAMRVLCG
jgi:methylthioribose-1-phosphate isomerase